MRIIKVGCAEYAAALTLASGAALAGAHGSYPQSQLKLLLDFLLVVALTHLRGFASFCTKLRAWLDSLHILLTFRCIWAEGCKASSW